MHLRHQIEAVGSTPCSVLITGETGTGKELIARAIHQGGGKGKPFVCVECSSLCDTLFESQMFGHVKGAFTGAGSDTLGFVRAAHGGTFFLDEIGELPLRLQAKLLRTLETRSVVPVGKSHAVPVDFRFMAATHRDLAEMVSEGSFREDLYFRLNVVQLNAKPLRSRPEDIEPLVKHFLHQLADVYGIEEKQLDDDVWHAFFQYNWPGNVRELLNVVEHVYAMSGDGLVTVDHLPGSVLQSDLEKTWDGGGVVPLDMAERILVERALRASKGNQAQAAQMLDIDRRRMYRLVDRHHLRMLTRVNRSDS